MKTFSGKAISWKAADGTIELVLDRAPCNEIGSATLGELEQFWRADKVWEPKMPAQRREELFSGWKQAVARCRLL